MTYSCPGFDPVELGFNTDYPTASFDLKIDIRSSMTVIALRNNIISINDLKNVTEDFFTFTLKG